MDADDTIAALATPVGKGALAVVRVSGAHSMSVVGSCLARADSLLSAPARTVRLATFRNPQTSKPVDEVMITKFVAPCSYTGEDVVEVTCHGGRLVVREVLEALLAAGARYARPGEFTRRGLLNGKLDLLRAEAIQALIESRSEAGRLGALSAYFGGQGEALAGMAERIRDLLAGVEARLEFPDEDSVGESVPGSALAAGLGQIRDLLQTQLAQRQRVKAAEQGIRVVIVGMPNVGKSTLFNLLVGYDRSLVHCSEGTTRDYVTEDVYIGGHHVTLVDTAGIGEPGNEVERMGMERSWGMVNSSDVLLWVTEAGTPLAEVERSVLGRATGGRAICVISKTDRFPASSKEAFCSEQGILCLGLCLREPASGPIAAGFLQKRVSELAGEESGDCLVNNARQEASLRLVLEILDSVREDEGEEIVAYRLGEALDVLEEFVGRTASQDILDRIFDSFCIGK